MNIPNKINAKFKIITIGSRKFWRAMEMDRYIFFVDYNAYNDDISVLLYHNKDYTLERTWYSLPPNMLEVIAAGNYTTISRKFKSLLREPNRS